ncbi:MAG TPA: YdcF family protein, partial [Anaerolineales bacterium]|nr:YdcF family protein [Anaerolineales bacterium]
MSPLDAVLEFASDLTKSLLPGGIPFLLIGLTVGVVLLLRREGRRSRAVGWLAGLAIFYWLLAMPLVAGGLERVLASGYRPLDNASEASGAELVVVLTGGGVTLRADGQAIDILSQASAYRMLEAERLYDLLGGPRLLISGGPAGGVPEGNPEAEAMKAELIARGIPEAQIWVESASPDTHQQAILVGRKLHELGIEPFVLVTSAEHMRRALGAFRQEGMDPIPSAAPSPRGVGPPLGNLLP